MRRPFPAIPRAARRARLLPDRVLLACPRISPEWELAAIRSLIKPQRKEAILHRSAEQIFPANARSRVCRAAELLADRIGYHPAIHWPQGGDYLFAVDVAPADLPAAKGLAVLLSLELAGAHLVLGRLFVRDGRFFRRERGIKLNMVPASNVHLSRPIRAGLAGVKRVLSEEPT